MEKAGFGVSRLSGGDWSINSIPPGLDNVDIMELINEVIASVSNGGLSVKEKIFENIAFTISSKAAIPYGRKLQNEEKSSLVADWMSLNNKKYTPNGKIIAITISLDQLSKMF